jgi:hypothetical protein
MNECIKKILEKYNGIYEYKESNFIRHVVFSLLLKALFIDGDSYRIYKSIRYSPIFLKCKQYVESICNNNFALCI